MGLHFCPHYIVYIMYFIHNMCYTYLNFETDYPHKRGIRMIIHGLQKTTLLDFPGHVASTIFFGGCNFRCPFCHNMNLVLCAADEPTISEEELFHHLNTRKGILDGVCITGGEPTLQKDLVPFIEKIKALGYLVKLDTNGSNPAVIEELFSKGLVDYIAMDIKSSPDRYAEICGLESFDFAPIRKSISLLINGPIPYEFRTTMVKEYHNEETVRAIANLLDGAKAYYLQSFVDSDFVPNHNLHAFEKEELVDFANILKAHIDTVELRGVD